MRKNLTFLILNFCFFTLAQNLNLRNAIDKSLEFPQEIHKNDILLIYETNGGWSAYDYVNYYFIDTNGNVSSYSEEKPKAYLNNEKLKRTIKKIDLNQEKKDRIIQIIFSKEVSELLKWRTNEITKVL